VRLLVFHAYINKMHGSRSKIRKYMCVGLAAFPVPCVARLNLFQSISAQISELSYGSCSKIDKISPSTVLINTFLY
jgi:hypothetical protein